MKLEGGGLRLLLARIINRFGLPFGIYPFSRTFEYEVDSQTLGRAHVFDQIYRENYWRSGETKSGVGSEVKLTIRYRLGLSQVIEERGFNKIFDTPCGDLNWMVELIENHCFDYIGGDISETLIMDIREKFPLIDLRIFDICNDEFPHVDVWHCRDCLFHLSFNDIRHALLNFLKSGIPFALLTTHRARILENRDISTGGFRYLDLERPPFNLPRAERYIPDYKRGFEFPRFVGLWPKDAISKAAESWPVTLPPEMPSLRAAGCSRLGGSEQAAIARRLLLHRAAFCLGGRAS